MQRNDGGFVVTGTIAVSTKIFKMFIYLESRFSGSAIAQHIVGSCCQPILSFVTIAGKKYQFNLQHVFCACINGNYLYPVVQYKFFVGL